MNWISEGAGVALIQAFSFSKSNFGQTVFYCLSYMLLDMNEFKDPF